MKAAIMWKKWRAYTRLFELLSLDKILIHYSKWEFHCVILAETDSKAGLRIVITTVPQMRFLIIFYEVHFHKDQLKWKLIRKTELQYDLTIAQILTSKLIYLVSFHFKTLRHFVTKPRQNIDLADSAGCASHGGLLPTWSATAFCDVLSDMY